MALKREGEKLAFKGGLFGASVYVSLHTANPTSTNELTVNGYARVEMTSDNVTVNASTGTASNGIAIVFPSATGQWPDPTHAGIWTASTGGNLLFSGAFSNDIAAPGVGAQTSIPAGDMEFTIPTDD